MPCFTHSSLKKKFENKTCLKLPELPRNHISGGRGGVLAWTTGWTTNIAEWQVESLLAAARRDQKTKRQREEPWNSVHGVFPVWVGLSVWVKYTCFVLLLFLWLWKLHSEFLPAGWQGMMTGVRSGKPIMLQLCPPNLNWLIWNAPQFHPTLLFSFVSFCLHNTNKNMLNCKKKKKCTLRNLLDWKKKQNWIEGEPLSPIPDSRTFSNYLYILLNSFLEPN